MKTAELRLLGPGELIVDGRPVPLRSQKTLALLAYLALEGPTARERLANLLWDSPSARGNLRVELHHLERAAPGLVARRRGVLELGEVAVDVRRFEAAANREGWSEAHALCRGPFLEGAGPAGTPELEDWIGHWRERLRERKRTVLAGLARQADAGERVGYLLERLADDPLDEEACREAMRTYLHLGEPGKALRLYHDYADFLERELGLPPERATRSLADAARRGEAPLAAPGEAAFVGRERELERMAAAFANNLGVFVRGEPGIGKTRLVEAYAEQHGLRLLLLHGRPGDPEVPYSTLARALRQMLDWGVEPEGWARRELARLLPELGEPPPEANPARLLAALAHLLRRFEGREWLWGHDDLQYVDPATLALVAKLPDLLSDRPGVVTFRSGTLGPGAARWVEAMLARGRAVLLELEPLPPPAVARLLGVAPEEARRLARYTGGNPFFLLQVRRSEGWSSGAEGPLATVRQRMVGLSSAARRLLELAAVAGSAHDPHLAAEVLGLRPLPLAEAADELERAGLFRRGQPAHDLVVEAVLAALGEAERRFWHAGVARALERHADALPALVAFHFQAAGLPAQAADHHLAAARAAERGFAPREALAQYEQALAAAPPERREELKRASIEARYRLHLALLDWEGAERLLRRAEALTAGGPAPRLALGWGWLHFNRGAPDEAEADADRALAAPGLAPELRAEALYLRAASRQARGEHAAALADVEAALAAQPGPDWPFRSWAHNTAAISLVALGRTQEALEANRTAHAGFRATGDRAGEANAERVFAEAAARRGARDEAARHYDLALELARGSGHQGVRAYVLASALLFYEAAGAAARVRELAEEGRAIEGPYRTFFARRLGP